MPQDYFLRLIDQIAIMLAEIASPDGCGQPQRPDCKTTSVRLPYPLDFIQVPGYPSAIRVFALTHSRRIVVQR